MVDTVLHPEKIGIGAWEGGDPMDLSAPGVLYAAMRSVGFKWYYTWHTYKLSGDDGSVPYLYSFWDTSELTSPSLAAAKSNGQLIIGYNEPWNTWNAISPTQALDAWPQLMALGNRLATPSFRLGGIAGSWMDEFMAGIASRGYRLDVMNYHFYWNDLNTLRSELADVYSRWGRPIIITEWALTQPGDYTGTTLNERQAGIFGTAPMSFAEQAEYARQGILMMDTIPYLEKHSWFAATEGGGWYLNSGVFHADGSTTVVGDMFNEILGGSAGTAVPTPPPPVVLTPFAEILNAESIIINPDLGTVIPMPPFGSNPPTLSAYCFSHGINRRNS